MKIIHIVKGKLDPNSMNGINRVVHELASCQAEMGYDVRVIGLSNSREQKQIIRKYQFSLVKSNRYKIDPNFKEEVSNNCIHNVLYHIHGGFTLEYYPILKLLRKCKSKYIFTPHGCYNREALKKSLFKKKIFFKLFDRSLLKNAWKVQFLGVSEFNEIDYHIKNINKVLIPNGINAEIPINEKDKVHSNLVFGFVGRIDKYTKGLDLLFNAFLEYKSNGGKGSLWIVGDGADLVELRKITNVKDGQRYIKFYGAKFGKEKINIINQFDVFVHTSRFEGLPMAVLEAANMGKPLLISAETNLGEYVTRYNCGFVLNRNNSLQIENALFQFDNISVNKFCYMKKNSKLMIEKEFKWPKISKNLISGF